MANDYLVHKWRLWFRIFDVNHTGQFSQDDETGDEERFVHLNNLSPERKKEVIAASKQMMEEHYFRGKPGPLTEQAFVDMNNDEFKADKNKFKERMQKLFSTDFGIMDFSGEGSITQDVFINAFQAAGHDNVELLTKFFNAYGPKDQKVSIQVFVDSWVHFTTCEDSSNPDIVKQYLEAGV
ncbi:sarcoplasmic calcium-binding protein-like [Mercenaria mercenaria]|uniref:sarcoplasmic calcium-binding protein-like n=1 Tax=Mercenaria mercenaria TaxID=6596 RepID=UPI00234F586C|nr:sarcoplasmic calcium-binding protein-like [Mercenaria mercenaria]